MCAFEPLPAVSDWVMLEFGKPRRLPSSGGDYLVVLGLLLASSSLFPTVFVRPLLFTVNDYGRSMSDCPVGFDSLCFSPTLILKSGHSVVSSSVEGMMCV